mgnify:CR=1 FL=1
MNGDDWVQIIGGEPTINPIFKNYDILVDGKSYKPFYFIKLLTKVTKACFFYNFHTYMLNCMLLCCQRLI